MQERGRGWEWWSGGMWPGSREEVCIVVKCALYHSFKQRDFNTSASALLWPSRAKSLMSTSFTKDFLHTYNFSISIVKKPFPENPVQPLYSSVVLSSKEWITMKTLNIQLNVAALLTNSSTVNSLFISQFFIALILLLKEKLHCWTKSFLDVPRLKQMNSFGFPILFVQLCSYIFTFTKLSFAHSHI